MKTITLIAVGLSITLCIQVLINAHNISYLADTNIQVAKADSLAAVYDSLLTCWHEGKIAILEAAVFDIAQHNWLAREYCYVIQRHDSLWYEIIQRVGK